ncbi:HET-domain-containing protein [Aaosphaeria arxii CBS 175.79]|uniref:HET-domain-containing protein n=1 Tax=Aaosphaeria arxii CBS 175.79 TaxID=1450172 RepID=A0A6A5Y1U7_9PLEO|nr:HET-domain-containing protein [Aaosphaeria arxii CBS 175.79]KAF2019183.1 HET-domain-containing protein [Aaosphaeria arxii CBS 175.79]
MSTAPPYDYQPLRGDQCIRLLFLMPGELEDPLVIHLLSVPLREAPSFEALSYTWGTPEDTLDISCGPRGGIVSIRPNLRDALQYLRLPHDIKKLWVDALCINQEDIEERSSQVAMMASIYWHASQVVVWLGLDDECVPASDVFDLIRTTSDHAWNLHKEHGSFGEIPYFHQTDLEQLDEDRWNNLATFFNTRQWFQRGWVIQELGLAYNARFLCSQEELSFVDYLPFVRWLVTKASIILERFDFSLESQYLTVGFWLSTRTPEGIAHMSFREVLRLTCSIQCSQPHDYVYAFLGHPSAYEAYPGDTEPFEKYEETLAGKNRRCIAIPDYTKPAERVFAQVVRDIILHDCDLKMLSHVFHSEQTIQDCYASWTPRWHSIPEKFALGLRSRYKASNDSVLTLHFENDHMILLGHPIDVVAYKILVTVDVEDMVLVINGSRGSPMRDGLESLWNTVRFRNWQNKSNQKLGRIDFLHALTAGYLDSESVDDSEIAERFKRSVAAYQLLHIGKRERPLSDEETKDLERRAEGGVVEDFLLAISLIMEHHTFVVTRSGRVGWCPLLTKPGDELVLVAGGNVPLTLRKSRTGNHRLVGESYIQGAMKGEAFDEEKLAEVVIC